MASKIEAVEETDDAIIIFVTHLNTDSFSRSVNRAANKAWRERVCRDRFRALHTQYCSARYGHSNLDGGTHTMSTIVYTKSHAHADDILNRLYDTTTKD